MGPLSASAMPAEIEAHECDLPHQDRPSYCHCSESHVYISVSLMAEINAELLS